MPIPAAYPERIANDGRSPHTLRVRCTIPNESERPILLILNETDADLIAHHARQLARQTARTVRIRTTNGRTITARPLADVLSPRTRALVAQLRKGTSRHAR